MYRNQLKEETNKFLQEYVYPHSKFSRITNENADDIVDFIVDTYIVPLVNNQEENIPVDKNLLKMAESAVDDICDN